MQMLIPCILFAFIFSAGAEIRESVPQGRGLPQTLKTTKTTFGEFALIQVAARLLRSMMFSLSMTSKLIPTQRIQKVRK